MAMPLHRSKATSNPTMHLTTTLLFLVSSSVTGPATAAAPTWSLLATATALFPSLVLGNDNDRPNAVYKVNIHAQHDSSDDSSDDDSGDADGCLLRNPDKTCRIWNNVQHFRNDFGQLEFKWSSCDDPYDDSHDDFEEVAAESSLYQRVIFEENLIKEDKCLRLDATLQQCSSYRPHYHEPFVHYSASYLNKGFLSGVKRVVFVGGGDSMLLHEVLKYEGLEMVLGLELDQKVTRNSFEHFKTQPHFSNPKVQWWFGDGAKSLTLLPRSYFGTFDLVLLDLSETVMSMTVTKGLDVFGAMKLLLSDTGIMVKNDFGYFEKLSKVFDTCIQLLFPDVTYICDYELVLCGSDKVDFLNPTFHHLKGGKGIDQVETLVYKPLDDVEDHWGPVTDYSKYWGEPRKCNDTSEETSEDEVAYAGILLVLEAENVGFNGLKDASTISNELEKTAKNLGYEVLSTTTRDSAGAPGGVAVALALKEGYILAETWPDAKYCKLDIHLWGNFEKQEDFRTHLLKSFGVKKGDFSSYRIVTSGMRGVNTRAKDLKTVGPDLSKIGQCEEVKEGSRKSITLNTSSGDEEALRPIIDAGYDDIISLMIRQTDGINAVVLCNVKGAPCRAKHSLEKQGFLNIVTLWSCTPEDDKELDTNAAKQGEFIQKWRQNMKDNSSEFSLCAKKVDVALREVAQKVHGINIVVVDALAPSPHVTGCHQYFLTFWKTIKKPYLFLLPILDANDQHRNFFLKSRYNHAEEEPEYYSEIYVGNGEKTMSFGLIHEGHSTSLMNFMRVETVLNARKEVKFAEIRKITIRGAMRQQTDYDPVTFSWAAYDQQPGLEQFYGQQPIGLQSMLQYGLDPAATPLSSGVIKAALQTFTQQFTRELVKDSFHEIGEGALYIALLDKGQVVVTWDGATNMNINIFTYDEAINHGSAIAQPIMMSLPKMNLMLRDEQPRGYGRVVNSSDRINRKESPNCYDHYKMCRESRKKGNCSGGENASVWMAEHCRFSCGICDSLARSEL